jgi:ubiquinone/menaquinone biosynthesis C-methylase UbiE
MNSDAENRRLIEEMNAYYDKRAPWHDHYMEYESIEAMEKRLEPLVKFLDDYIAQKDILEIACGTGNWTQFLARRARSVTAVDFSPAALDIAKTKVSVCGNVSLKVADAYSLDNVDGVFNMAFAADWWSHIPIGMIPPFLDAVTAKLSAGSKVVIIDMSLSEYWESRPFSYDEDGNRVSLRKLVDGSEYRVIKNFPTESDMRIYLSGYGRNVLFKEFPSLKRWAVVFETA